MAYFGAKLGTLHDPELLPGAAAAANRIVQAIRDRRRIVIYGDYDVDGVCGTSVLWSCLRLAGGRDVDYYIPHRVEEGYGLNAEALRKIAAAHPSPLVVTVDRRISAVAEAELARELGIELVVSDHHTIGAACPAPPKSCNRGWRAVSIPMATCAARRSRSSSHGRSARNFGDGKRNRLSFATFWSARWA